MSGAEVSLESPEIELSVSAGVAPESFPGPGVQAGSHDRGRRSRSLGGTRGSGIAIDRMGSSKYLRLPAFVHSQRAWIDGANSNGVLNNGDFDEDDWDLSVTPRCASMLFRLVALDVVRVRSRSEPST
jgi:hypothetical protein